MRDALAYKLGPGAVEFPLLQKWNSPLSETPSADDEEYTNKLAFAGNLLRY